jgi:tyrosine-protein kinase Etk/Wzc
MNQEKNRALDVVLPSATALPRAHSSDDEESGLSFVEVLTALGLDKRWILAVTALASLLALLIVFWITPTYTARTTLLPPNNNQSGGSAAALAALGSLGPLSGLTGGLAKSPDELYVALLKSDSILRALDARFELRKRYERPTFEALRLDISKFIHIGSDKKSGLITVEVDDADATFAAKLANAHAEEIAKVLDRLAVSEAQLRRVFFERQLKETKEHLVQAEQNLRLVQEKSGVLVLDKQAESVLLGAAQLRGAITEREVRLKVLRGMATEQNPDLMRLNAELQALRAELARTESRKEGAANTATPTSLQVGNIPQAAIAYVRARRELKVQETLLEGMIRQYEAAKLDEAKEGPALQQVDVAEPPDRKSKPARGLIVGLTALVALLLCSMWSVMRRYLGQTQNEDAQAKAAWQAMKQAWVGRSSSARA